MTAAIVGPVYQGLTPGRIDSPGCRISTPELSMLATPEPFLAMLQVPSLELGQLPASMPPAPPSWSRVSMDAGALLDVVGIPEPETSMKYPEGRP